MSAEGYWISRPDSKIFQLGLATTCINSDMDSPFLLPSVCRTLGSQRREGEIPSSIGRRDSIPRGTRAGWASPRGLRHVAAERAPPWVWRCVSSSLALGSALPALSWDVVGGFWEFKALSARSCGWLGRMSHWRDSHPEIAHRYLVRQ
jgi:hypothetical protein